MPSRVAPSTASPTRVRMRAASVGCVSSAIGLVLVEVALADARVARAALLELAEEHRALGARVAIRAAVAVVLAAVLAVADEVLQLDDAVEQGLGARRATGHVHVDGHDAIDA